MRTIRVRNVHEALPEAIHQLEREHIAGTSRNGDVLVSPDPVATTYLNPTERVLFWEERDANPFFHFFECLWMIAGRNDVAWLEQFNPRMREFSDDGVRFHGAYGFRWRDHWGFDQVQLIAERLAKDSTDRRQVLTIWDPASDLRYQDTKDLPCNDLVFFSRHREGLLDMTVCCRSNDIIWGCYGANAVHFSFLQEFIAAAANCLVGRYTQVSNNWHGYQKTLDPLVDLATRRREPNGNERYYNPYESGEVCPYPIVNSGVEAWLRDLNMFMAHGEEAIGYQDPFFRRVALPLLRAWRAYKMNQGEVRYDLALEQVADCNATDWRKACAEWLLRRRVRWAKNSS